MHLVLLSLGLLVGAYILLRWIASLDSHSLARALKYFSLIIVAIAILLMILTGRAAHGLAVLLGLLPFVMRWYLVRRQELKEKTSDRSETKQVPQKTGMTLEEAYEILDLPENASRKEVMKAYRKLMEKVHPDKGGSTYLASQINEAKDLIIDHLVDSEKH